MTSIEISWRGKLDYQHCWQEMKTYTEARTAHSADQLWLVEHDPIFTLGLAGKEEHILLRKHSIPILHTDRGGQVTYHGPGQIIIYHLLDLKRLGLSIRELVTQIENGVVSYLAELGIAAYGDREAPGVYVAGKKIASLGLKVRKGCTYHGLSFNYNLDTTPFAYINPCGYAGLQVVNLATLLAANALPDFKHSSYALAQHLITSILKKDKHAL